MQRWIIAGKLSASSQVFDNCWRYARPARPPPDNHAKTRVTRRSRDRCAAPRPLVCFAAAALSNAHRATGDAAQVPRRPVAAARGRFAARHVRLVSGRTRHVCRVGEEREVLMHIGGPGLWTGEYAMLSGAHPIGSVIADEPTQALHLSASQWRQLIEEDPRCLAYFAALMAGRFCDRMARLRRRARADARRLGAFASAAAGRGRARARCSDCADPHVAVAPGQHVRLFTPEPQCRAVEPAGARPCMRRLSHDRTRRLIRVDAGAAAFFAGLQSARAQKAAMR